MALCKRIVFNLFKTEVTLKIGGLLVAVFLAINSKASIIEKFSMEDFSVIIDQNDQPPIRYDNMNLLFSSSKERFNFNFFKTSEGDFLPVNISTVFIYDTNTLDIMFEIERMFSRDETAAVFSILNGLERYSVEVSLFANMNVRGRLDSTPGPISNGLLIIQEGSLVRNDLPVLSSINANIRAENGLVTMENLTGQICGANFSATAQTSSLRPTSHYQGTIDISNLDLVCFGDALLLKNKILSGNASAQCQWDFAPFDANSLETKWMIALNDADISIVPVIGGVFKFIGLKNRAPMQKSDVVIAFTSKDSLITITEGRITNKFAAVVIEPGGTIDLENEYIDFYVVAVPLKELDSIFRKLPIINSFFAFTDKLTRLRVKGKWTQPPASLISKHPVEDLREGSVDFFRTTIKTGGQIPADMKKGFEKFKNTFDVFKHKPKKQN